MKHRFRPFGALLPGVCFLTAAFTAWLWASIRAGGSPATLIAPTVMLGWILWRAVDQIVPMVAIDPESITRETAFGSRTLVWDKVLDAVWVPGRVRRLRLRSETDALEISAGTLAEGAAMFSEIRRHVSLPEEPVVAINGRGGGGGLGVFGAMLATWAAWPDPFWRAFGLIGALLVVSRPFLSQAVWAGEQGLAIRAFGRTKLTPWSEVRLGRADDAAVELATPAGRIRLGPEWRDFVKLRQEVARRLGASNS